jgi:hypothetical protein
LASPRSISHAILPIVRQAVDFHPDLLVFYMGNNEVVGPFGPGSVATGTMPPLAFIRASWWIRGTRIAQLLARTMRWSGWDRDAFKAWRGMEMFAGKTVSAEDPRLKKVYANFETNLRDMVKVARGSGIKVVVSTVAVDLRDSAPFASLHRSALSRPGITAMATSIRSGEDRDGVGQ